MDEVKRFNIVIIKQILKSLNIKHIKMKDSRSLTKSL